MSEQPDDFVARVAYLYYVKDQTQSQIAKTINIDRSTVSRLLKRARAKGIVTVRVNHANTEIFELEEKLRQAFKLRQVVIIPSSASDSVEAKNQQLATAAAHYLKRVIKPHDRVGFAWGTTLAGMIGQLNHPVHTNAIFVPLVGGPSPKNTKYHVNAIVYDAARQFNGKALFIDAAAVQKTQALHDQIVNSQNSNPCGMLGHIWT